MVVKVYSCEWGVILFCDSLYTYVSGVVLRKLLESKATTMIVRNVNIFFNGGYGVYGIRIAMGPNVPLRGGGDNEFVFDYTARRRKCGTLIMRGIFSGESDVK